MVRAEASRASAPSLSCEHEGLLHGGAEVNTSVSQTTPVKSKDVRECRLCGYAIFYFAGSKNPSAGGGSGYTTKPGWYHVARKPFIGCPGALAAPKEAT